MAEGDELFLENLEEVVCDENKIITYKGLSSMLDVSANRAKEMLSIFADQQSSKGNELNVTFLLGGTPSDGTKGYRFLLVTRSHLEGMKSKFSHISCCHIYSVQRSRIKNFEILHTADSEMMKNSLFNLNAWSGISCPEAKRGSTEARRKEALEEPRILTNGFENKSAVTLAKPDVHSQREISSKSSSSKPNLNAKQITSASFFGKNLKQKKGSEPNQDTSRADITKDARPSTQKHGEKMITAVGEEKKGLNYFGNPEEGKTQIRGDRRKDDKEKMNREEPKEDEKEEEKKKCEEEKDEKKEGKKKGRKEDEKPVKQRVNREEETTETDGNNQFTKMKSESQGEEEDVSKPSKKKKRKKHQMEENSVKRRKTEVHCSESEEDDEFESFIKSSKECHSKPKKTREIDKDEVSKQDKEVSKENSLENLETNKTEKGGKEYKKVNKLSKTKKTVPSEKLKDENRLQEGESKMADTEAEQIVVDEAKPKEKRRIKKKVLKSKTFMNEEGYMVTEKVYESESASEESEPEDRTNGSSKLDAVIHRKPIDISLENKKIKAEASKNKTQSSLMSFFRKK